jgi:SpoVK/Ycf46/Vps4 family AAA+-type ATPase
MGAKAFTVNLTYGENDGESVIVIADSYQDALSEALEERVDERMPIEVELIDPDLGAVIKFIAEGSKKVAKAGVQGAKVLAKGSLYALKGVGKATALGAKYAIKAGASAGKKLAKGSAAAISATGKLVISEAEKKVVQRLLREAYASDPALRNAARHQLKKWFPTVYEVCDFSRS